jgi:tetratricopeptide (TPR) repeat protein
MSTIDCTPAEEAHNMGNTLHAGGDHASALVSFAKATHLYENLLGEEHPKTLAAKRSLSVTYSALGRTKEYLEHMRPLLDTHQSVLGAEHPDSLSAQSNYAGALCDVGRYEEAVPHLKEVLEKRQTVLGPQHSDSLLSMHDYAMTLGQLDRWAEAAEIMKELVPLTKKVLGEAHPTSLAYVQELTHSVELADAMSRASADSFVKRIPLHPVSSAEEAAEVSDRAKEGEGADTRGEERTGVEDSRTASEPASASATTRDRASDGTDSMPRPPSEIDNPQAVAALFNGENARARDDEQGFLDALKYFESAQR